jgi:hypothetical protein
MTRSLDEAVLEMKRGLSAPSPTHLSCGHSITPLGDGPVGSSFKSVARAQTASGSNDAQEAR